MKNLRERGITFCDRVAFNESLGKYTAVIDGGRAILAFLEKFHITDTMFWRSLKDKNTQIQEACYLKDFTPSQGHRLELAFEFDEDEINNKVDVVMCVYITKDNFERFFYDVVRNKDGEIDNIVPLIKKFLEAKNR